MVNDYVRIGIEVNASSLKRLSLFAYRHLKSYRCYSGYRLTAISKATGIHASRKKSTRRAYRAGTPYLSKRILVSCYGFKIEDGKLRLPLGEKQFELIPLTPHTIRILSEPSLNVRSFTITETSLSLCVSKEVTEVDCSGVIGVDRNLRNLTVSNQVNVTRYDLSDAVTIASRTRKIMGSFKRDDARIRRRLASKYRRRIRDRVQDSLHNTTKQIVAYALEHKEAIALENIEGIRRLYRKGNSQGPKSRHRMNNWSFGEAQRQLEYKARWVGLPVIHLRPEVQVSSVINAGRDSKKIDD
jgi:putative transposase